MQKKTIWLALGGVGLLVTGMLLGMLLGFLLNPAWWSTVDSPSAIGKWGDYREWGTDGPSALRDRDNYREWDPVEAGRDSWRAYNSGMRDFGVRRLSTGYRRGGLGLAAGIAALIFVLARRRQTPTTPEALPTE